MVDIRSRWRALLFGGLAIAVVAARFLTWFRYDVYGVSADRGHVRMTPRPVDDGDSTA